jgi:catechol 2,3-dioxygenase-like lactoylglutathione lyase family enzyme
MKMKVNFAINHLDHVAILVNDLEMSAQWYEKHFGLKRYQPEKWGPSPIFLLAGKTGLALFPKKHGSEKHKSVDHFAFNIDLIDFEKARKYFDDIELDYEFQDHYYFHSLCVRDPDGYIVELTTLVVEEKEFY